ncbi:invasion associated locus B family protein [Hirschia litorea]|uniref:Invasion associated locus B family protein n=1 Tax=Hirschia litorea TaxID=1199156 RepID=A0ABW2IM33_9PROT
MPKPIVQPRIIHMTHVFIRRILVLSMLAGSMSGIANAQVKAIGSFKDWQVFTQKVDGDLVCFAATEAMDKAPKDVTHGDVHFYVANWKSGAGKEQPSLKVGYELRGDIPPEVVIGRERWRMYTSANEAFLEDKNENSVVRALKRGSNLRVEAVSARDTRTAYHFSLSGSSAAIDRAAAACK